MPFYFTAALRHANADAIVNISLMHLIWLCSYVQLASLLACVIKLDKALAGITIIALGTSLPDTFASRTAALHDANADAAIGNITGRFIDILW